MMDIRPFFSLTDPATAAGVGLALKGVVVLGAAGLIALALRRASASARHLVWLLGVLGVLSLPLLSLIAPPLHMPAAKTASVSVAAGAVPPSFSPVTHGAPKPYHDSMPPDASEARDRRPMLLAAIWAIVAFGALVRLGAGLALALRTARRCPMATDTMLIEEMRRLTETAGVRRRVALRQGATVAVPMTAGLLRPIVLLPEGAEAWPIERLRAALRHELAHIQRGDWAWHGLAEVMRALHWFNPLAWLAAKQIREESERACDDAVLAAGTRPTEYAGHLLEIARRLSHPGAAGPGAAVAMARRPQVEDRLRAILRPGGSRSAVTRRRLALAFAASLLLLAPIAALRTTAQDQTEEKARADALKISSISNLRQIGLSLIVYAQKHGGKLPDADHWVDAIAPMLAEGDPDMLRSLMHDQAAPADQPYSYAFNRNLSGASVDAMKDPSQVVMVFESTSGKINAADAGTTLTKPGRHEGGVDYLFADGKVHWAPDGAPVAFTADPAPPTPTGPLGTGVLTGRAVFKDGRPAAGISIMAVIRPADEAKLMAAANGKVLLPIGVTAPMPAGTPRPSPRDAKRVVWSETTTGANGVYRLTGLTTATYTVGVPPLLPSAINDLDGWNARAIDGVKAQEGKTVTVPDLTIVKGSALIGVRMVPKR